MNTTNLDPTAIRCAEWTAQADRMIAQNGDLRDTTNCDACGRPFPEWAYDDSTPLVLTSEGVLCEECAHDPEVGALCSDHGLSLTDGCYLCDPDDYVVIDGRHINKLAAPEGVWSDPVVEEYDNESYQPWGDDITSGWEATYRAALPGYRHVVWTEGAYVTTVEHHGETAYVTNAVSDLRVMDGENEVTSDIIPSHSPTAQYHFSEAEAHAACEAYIRSDLRTYPGVLDGAYEWAIRDGLA